MLTGLRRRHAVGHWTHDNQNIRKIDLDAIDFATVEFQARDIYRSAEDYRQFEFE